MNASVAISTFAVASSKIRIFFLFKSTRDKQISYFYPIENSSGCTSDYNYLGSPKT